MLIWAGPTNDDAELRYVAMFPYARFRNRRGYRMSPKPMKLLAEDSKISDDDDSVSQGASATHKKKGYVDPKHGFISTVREGGIFLGQSSQEVVTSLADEEEIYTSDEDSMLGSYPVASIAEKSMEVSFSGREDEDDNWYEINQEAEELFQSTIRASHQSMRKASVGKRRSSVSLHFHPFGKSIACHAREFGCSSDSEELESDGEFPEGQKSTEDHRNIEDSLVVALESFKQEKKLQKDTGEQPVDIMHLQCRYAEHSAVELLDNLQSNSVLVEDDPDKYARYKRRHILSEKSSYTLGNRSLNNDDPIEPICSLISSDDDESEPSLMIVAAEATKKTMADRFQEAVGTSILNEQGMQCAFSKPLGTGLSGKLQQVMQDEKDKDAQFLMVRQSIEPTHDHSSFLDVKIQSRYLEGKLVVCRCSVTYQREGVQELDKSETVLEHKYSERVFIFNFRTCNDVDLDVGNCVRVHSPWKEVGTSRYGNVILCSYFSQIKSDDC